MSFLTHSEGLVFGAVVRAQPITVRLLALLMGFAAIGIVSYVGWGTYTRKAHVEGYLVPDKGLLRVFSMQSGTVTKRYVYEGQVVNQGEPLFGIASDKQTDGDTGALATVIAELKARGERLREEQQKQQSIDALQMKAASQRIDALQRERGQATREYDLQVRRTESARETLSRYAGLAKSGFMSDAQLQGRRDDVLDQEGKQEGAARVLSGIARELATAEADFASATLRSENSASAVERQVAELKQQAAQTESLRSNVLVASAPGTVTAILAEVGQSVNTSTPLVSLVPKDSRLEAVLFVPSRSIGFVMLGQGVRLRLAAFPYQKFGHIEGAIREISKGLINPGDGAYVGIKEPVYRIIVGMNAQQLQAFDRTLPLQPGMSLEADIRLEERKLWQWIFDPILGVTGKV